ncbi:MAG: dicarboxylate/amino acid:cation symporter [Victivallaceae bacterium]|nr:dicarboxylate/amino acid:cation symporter [Victivallaceae bacterium]
MLKKIPLSMQIFAALVAGLGVGCLLAYFHAADVATIYVAPLGTMFLKLLQFVVVPVVSFSIMTGVISVKDIRKVGKIGFRAIVFFLVLTALAIVVGLLFSNLFAPYFRAIAEMETIPTAGSSQQITLATLVEELFPGNFIAPLLEADMLQVIFIAIILSFGVLAVGEKAEPLVKLIEAANEVSLVVMRFVIRLSPVGVFGLLVPVVAQNGASVLGNLFWVVVAVYSSFIVFTLVAYVPCLYLLTHVSPIKFFNKMSPAIVFAFSSSSSVGTLPLNMRCCERLGVRKEICNFVLPLGATINMDGTAIYQGVCAMFVAYCYGIHLTLGQMVNIVLVATVSAIGTAGVPGSGVVMLSMILKSAGLPLEGIALVAGIDRVLDMGRTTLNIVGDAVCAVWLETRERKAEGASREITEE